MVPASCAIYMILNQYPDYARFANKRKITYEDLEDFRDADRFKNDSKSCSRAYNKWCDMVVMSFYMFHIFDSNPPWFESIGLLGGLLSLYGKLFNYIGSLSINCLYRMKKKQQKSTTTKKVNRSFESTPAKPQYTKQSDDPN